jgi:hypothetical protein
MVIPTPRNARTRRGKIVRRSNACEMSVKRIARSAGRNALAERDESERMATAQRRYRRRSQLTLIDRRHRPPYHRRGGEPVAGDTGTATWEARSEGATRGWDPIGGGVNTRDRERAARRGFAARIGSGSARSWGRRTDRGSARAAFGSVPGIALGKAADSWFGGEMITKEVRKPGGRTAGFLLSGSAGGADAGTDRRRV